MGENIGNENIPLNLKGLDISIPAERRPAVKEMVINEFLDSLHISGGIPEFTDSFREDLKQTLLANSIKQENGNLSFQDMLYLTIKMSVQKYIQAHSGMVLNPKDSYVVINGISINYSRYQIKENGVGREQNGSVDDNLQRLSELAPKKSPRPQHRIDIADNVIFPQLEGVDGFQRGKNKGISLSDAYDMYGVPADLQKGMQILFGTEHPSYGIMNLIKLTLGVESYKGYNIVLEDKVRTSGYYQFQVKDGGWGKEKYDFSTETFVSEGDWSDKDTEIQILKGEDRKWIRKIRKYSSYEQALLSLPDTLLDFFPNFREQLKHLGDPSRQFPEELSSTEQTLLFLSNIYSKGGRTSQRLFTKVMEGDENAIIELYRNIHHADISNENTLKTVQRVANEIGLDIVV